MENQRKIKVEKSPATYNELAISAKVENENKSGSGQDVLPLEKNFRRNGLDYKLLERQENVMLFEVTSIVRGEKIFDGYEIFKVPIRKPWIYKDCHYEALPTDEQFGILFSSRNAYTESKAYECFDQLCRR